MKTLSFPILNSAIFRSALLLMAQLAHAQQPATPAKGAQPGNKSVALPVAVDKAAAGEAPLPALDPLLMEKEVAASKAVAPGSPIAPPAANPAVLSPAPIAPPMLPIPVKGGILLNFQGASLTDVLNYLSEAAGFVIVQEAPVSGTVNIVSRQAISNEEAVDLLNTVLMEKGYVAIRNGRILKIVSRKNAEKRDLPVRTGSDPQLIPRKDEMVTQILPLRFGDAAKLVENLRPLLADTATINANESSNSILLTDTQVNIRRIAEIIQAIDTSVASISTIHVYQLKFANAKELATVITQLFTTTTTGAGGQQQNNGRNRGGGFGGGPPGMPGGMPPASPTSEARQANSRVVAVADDQSNSLIISAPEEVIPSITDIVMKIDTNISDVTDTRIFRLQHADAVETADIINTLYGDAASQTQGTGRNANNQRQGQNRQGGGNPGMPQQGQPMMSGPQSERALLQSRVVAVGDGRTNSLLISAARDTMAQIAETIGRLDATDSKKQHVYVHSLQHADADGVADVLRSMLGQQTISNSQNGTSRLNQRSSNGAAMDTSDVSNTNSNSGRPGR